MDNVAHRVNAHLLHTKYGGPEVVRQVDPQMKEVACRRFGGHVPVGDEYLGSGCDGSAEGDVDAGSGSGSKRLTGMSDNMQSVDVGFF